MYVNRCGPPSPPHGTTNTERRSFGTGITTAISLRTNDHGTVMWMPLAGRIVVVCVASSSVRMSSDHTPVALTIVRARISISFAVDRATRAPLTLPAGVLREPDDASRS